MVSPGRPVGSRVAIAAVMDRALRLARAALESSGDFGLALSLSMLALHYLWVHARTGQR